MKTLVNKYILAAGIALVSLTTGCKKSFDLDINKDPNNATTASINTVFPQVLTATANQQTSWSNYGAQLVGYYANGGGVSGWGSIISYNYTTTDFQGLFNNTFKVLEDLQFVIDNGGTGSPEFVAAAKILKAYNTQLLVDAYNDIPYTDALQGKQNLQPKYDKAQDVYKAIAILLDEAIAAFKAKGTASSAFTSADFLYKGDLNQWIRFANTVKLKLMVKAYGKVQFANTTFDALGFITDDVMVNPGYTKDSGKQNRTWDYWAYYYDNTRANGSNYVPTPYILSFYTGNKLLDTARSNVTFKSGNNTATNQLGYQGSNAGTAASPSSWFRGNSATDYQKVGILKGPDAGTPLIYLFEARLMQAEARMKGYVTSGDVKTLFEQGVTASFRYLDKDNTGSVPPKYNPATQFATYKTNNSGSYLVNLDNATTDEQKLEAIITQKYIASNMILGHEAWNDYRRTGYPKVTGRTATGTFASSVSEATAADRLPTRIMYPESEFKYNEKNIPTIDKYTSKIFWAK